MEIIGVVPVWVCSRWAKNEKTEDTPQWLANVKLNWDERNQSSIKIHIAINSRRTTDSFTFVVAHEMFFSVVFFLAAYIFIHLDFRIYVS